MNDDTTAQYARYLRERAAHLRLESWYWTYPVWCWLRGYTK